MPIYHIKNRRLKINKTTVCPEQAKRIKEQLEHVFDAPFQIKKVAAK